MFIATVISSGLLALAFAGTGVMKATGTKEVVDGLGRLGVRPLLVRLIGLIELAGAVGTLVGLALAWLGVAAAGGLAMLMAGAISYHARAGDYRDPKLRGSAVMPVALLLLAIITVALRASTT